MTTVTTAKDRVVDHIRASLEEGNPISEAINSALELLRRENLVQQLMDEEGYFILSRLWGEAKHNKRRNAYNKRGFDTRPSPFVSSTDSDLPRVTATPVESKPRINMNSFKAEATLLECLYPVGGGISVRFGDLNLEQVEKLAKQYEKRADENGRWATYFWRVKERMVKAEAPRVRAVWAENDLENLCEDCGI